MSLHRLISSSGIMICLVLPGCGPSTQEEETFREFYAAVDDVWRLMATNGDSSIQGKLDAAVARVELETSRYKSISRSTRRKLHERNKTLHEGSIEKYKQVMRAPGGKFDFLAMNKKMSDLLVEAFTGQPPTRSSAVNVTSVLAAYEQAYKK